MKEYEMADEMLKARWQMMMSKERKKEREMLEKLCCNLLTYSDWLLLRAEAEELLAQEPVRYEYQDENGEWQQFEDKKHFIDNQKWGEPTRALYTSPPKRGPLSDDEIFDAWIPSKVTPCGQSFKAGVKFAEKAHGIGGGE